MADYPDPATIPAGRELDAMVAEYVLGYRRVMSPPYNYDGPCPSEPVLIPPEISERDAWVCLPSRGVPPLWFFVDKWSTDARDFDGLLHRLRNPPIGRGTPYELTETHGHCHARYNDGPVGTGETRMLAFCRALVAWAVLRRRHLDVR